MHKCALLACSCRLCRRAMLHGLHVLTSTAAQAAHSSLRLRHHRLGSHAAVAQTQLRHSFQHECSSSTQLHLGHLVLPQVPTHNLATYVPQSCCFVWWGAAILGPKLAHHTSSRAVQSVVSWPTGSMLTGRALPCVVPLMCAVMAGQTVAAVATKTVAAGTTNWVVP